MDKPESHPQSDFVDAIGDDEILILEYDLDDDAIGVGSSPAGGPSAAAPQRAPNLKPQRAPQPETVGVQVDDDADTPIDAGHLVVRVPRDPFRYGKPIGLVAAALLVGVGVWWFGIRDTGPQRVAKPTRVAAKAPKAAATAATPAAAVPEDIPADPRNVSVESVVLAGSAGDDTGDDVETPTTTEPETAPTVDPASAAPSTTAAAAEPETPTAPTSSGTRRVRSVDPAAAREAARQALFTMTPAAIRDGFERLHMPTAEEGIRVRLDDGRVVTLAAGETLVQLKNGNHFKGRVVDVTPVALTMEFTYGKMKIPQKDLHDIVDQSANRDLPLDSYRTGIVHLKNGNRLRGKVIEVTVERVVLGFPSARIVVSRDAVRDGEQAIEYTQDASSVRGVTNAPSESELRVRHLGTPYFDFDYGFSITPPKFWNRYAADALIGFASTPGSDYDGTMNVGGLFLERAALLDSMDELVAAIRQAVPQLQLDEPKTRKGLETPWIAQIDGTIPTTATVPGKRCRLFIYSHESKAFVIGLYGAEKGFDRLVKMSELSIRTFEFKN